MNQGQLVASLRSDNGPEFISRVLADWREENGVELAPHRVRSTQPEAYIERFNRTYREEVLNAYLFDSLDRVREITENWMRSYNEWRPHSSLGGLPPTVYREMLTADVPYYYELLKKKQEKLKEQKKDLMQKLLTGEVRVKI